LVDRKYERLSKWRPFFFGLEEESGREGFDRTNLDSLKDSTSGSENY